VDVSLKSFKTKLFPNWCISLVLFDIITKRDYPPKKRKLLMFYDQNITNNPPRISEKKHTTFVIIKTFNEII